MTNEKYYIARKDFEAYNPHYDLKNPIKIKKNDLLLCNGGIPEQMLHDNGAIAYNQYFVTDKYSARGYVTHSMLVSGINPIFDFRTFCATLNNKDNFNNNLLNGVAQIPLFYWLEDYVLEDCVNQPSNSQNSYTCITKDIFGKEIVLPVNIKSCDRMVLSHDGTFIGFIEGYKTKKVDLAEIKKDILTVANKAIEEFEKAVNVILARYDT